MDQFVEVFNSNGDILIEKLKKEANGQEFDIYNYITLYALDVICGKYLCIYNNKMKRGFEFTLLLNIQHQLGSKH